MSKNFRGNPAIDQDRPEEMMSPLRFSANLGMLWTELPLPQAIRAAAHAGFDAVECHWPYDYPAAEVLDALTETGLPMLGLNTSRGEPGEFGLSALTGCEGDARAAIDTAIAYAAAVHAEAIHVMAGQAEGADARHQFISNLRYACSRTQRMVLIEPLNPVDAPGYFLRSTQQARQIIEDVNLPNLRLMFDCYHVGRTEGDVMGRLADLMPIVGHIQFAAVPDRGPPDHGDVDFDTVFEGIARLGWTRPLGAEYRPVGPTDQSLAWLRGYSSTR